jgi:hypothetical protein
LMGPAVSAPQCSAVKKRKKTVSLIINPTDCTPQNNVRLQTALQPSTAESTAIDAHPDTAYSRAAVREQPDTRGATFSGTAAIYQNPSGHPRGGCMPSCLVAPLKVGGTPACITLMRVNDRRGG